MKLRIPAGIRIAALTGVATAALALSGVPAAQAQAPVFLTFGLSGNVETPSVPAGLEGNVTITCEGNTSQTKTGQFPVGQATKGVSASLVCEGPVKVEGRVWKQGNQAAASTCTPAQLREPATMGINHANYAAVRVDGANISCTMSGTAG